MTNAGGEVEKGEPFPDCWNPPETVGILLKLLVGMLSWCSQYREQYGRSLGKKRVSIRSSNPTLGIHPDKTIIQKDNTPLCSQQHHSIAKAWKKPKCPATDEWIKEEWHI